MTEIGHQHSKQDKYESGGKQHSMGGLFQCSSSLKASHHTRLLGKDDERTVHELFDE